MKRDYRWNDTLILADTRVVRFVERGGVEDVLIVTTRDGSRDIVREHQVVNHYPGNPSTAYAQNHSRGR